MQTDFAAALLRYFDQMAPPQGYEALADAACAALARILDAQIVRVILPGAPWDAAAFSPQEQEMISACLTQCVGKPVCVCGDGAEQAQIWLFPFSDRQGAACALVCKNLQKPDTTAIGMAECVTRALSLRLAACPAPCAPAQDENAELAALLSHEFKTPLTVVLSSLQMLRRKLNAQDMADPQAEKYLDYAEQNVYKTLRLAANLLDAQLTGEEYAPQEEYTDIARVLQRMADGAQPYAQACGVTLAFENRAGGPCGMLCDLQRLDRIVLNLLSNAIRHTPVGGGVRLWLERRETAVQIVVEDDGSGLPEEAMPHLFEKFWRGDSTRDGSGLGLYIARRFAREMGGDITAQSRPGCGARFAVTLPVQLPKATSDTLFSTALPYGGDSLEMLLRIELSQIPFSARG